MEAFILFSATALIGFFCGRKSVARIHSHSVTRETVYQHRDIVVSPLTAFLNGATGGKTTTKEA